MCHCTFVVHCSLDVHCIAVHRITVVCRFFLEPKQTYRKWTSLMAPETAGVVRLFPLYPDPSPRPRLGRNPSFSRPTSPSWPERSLPCCPRSSVWAFVCQTWRGPWLRTKRRPRLCPVTPQGLVNLFRLRLVSAILKMCLPPSLLCPGLWLLDKTHALLYCMNPFYRHLFQSQH